MPILLKEYLKKYQSANEDNFGKKKKEKSKPNSVRNGVVVVDEDPLWQKPIIEEEVSTDDEAPQIDEDIEVKRMKRLEVVRSRKPYNVISENGSGWISISGQPQNFNHVGKDSDLSPPRNQWPRFDTQLTKEGRKTGLLTAAEVKKWIEKRRKDEIARFASMDASVSGKGAEAVFRDKDGKRIKKEDLLKVQMEERPKEEKLEWGKGLAQKREAEARLKELELEKDKPFARSRDDPDLDKMLRMRVRSGDPIAHLMKLKKPKILLQDIGNDEKMKKSGFIVPQTIPKNSWIKRGIEYPPNRYNIMSGRHWDGVDRSNGYEEELFKRQNEKQATETEAYMWSVVDM